MNDVITNINRNHVSSCVKAGLYVLNWNKNRHLIYLLQEMERTTEIGTAKGAKG